MNGAFKILTVMIAVLISVPIELIAQAPQNTMEAIVAVWTKRQAELKTATFSWVERRTIKKGAYPTRPTGKPAEPNPPEDATFEFPNTLTFSGDKLRFANEPQIWSIKSGQWIVDPYIYAFNGIQCRSFHDRGMDQFPSGVIRPDDRHSDFNDYHLFPILMTVRPVHPKLAPLDVYRMTCTGNTTVIGDSQCIELTTPAPASRSQTLIWVDPTKQFAITRFEHRANEKLQLRITTNYVQKGGLGWLPSLWDGVAMNSDGKMRLSFHSEVERMEINDAIPDDAFDFVFPENTRVFDETQPKSKVFIVKSDGQQRRVRGSELSRLSEDLVANDPPPGIGDKYMFVGVGVVVFICAGVFWYVLGRQRRLNVT